MDAPMNERYAIPQNKSQAAFVFSLLDLPGRKISATHIFSKASKAWSLSYTLFSG
ncbi:385_t:CDS:2 [Funneliformis geosporum]|nr:385_t:CDS:2 [Funneliformis geosporum]